MKSKQSNPAFSFVIMSIANFLAMLVFGLLYLLYKPNGERYTLLLIAAIISFVCAIAMLVLYGYFHKKIESQRNQPE